MKMTGGGTKVTAPILKDTLTQTTIFAHIFGINRKGNKSVLNKEEANYQQRRISAKISASQKDKRTIRKLSFSM